MLSICRGYLHNVTFAVTLILTLALGLGSTLTVFGLVSGLFFHPLPFPDSQALVSLTETDARSRPIPVSGQDFQDWKRDSQSFQQLAAFAAHRAKVTVGQEPLIYRCAEVTPGFFETLGVTPVLGRAFSARDDAEGNENLVILSDRLWRQLGAHPELLGSSLRIDNQPFAIMGIMPPGFDFPRRAEFWVPKVLAKDHSERGGRYLNVIGKLKPGVTLSIAEAEMGLVGQHLADQYPESNSKIGARVVGLKGELFGSLKTTTYLLFAAAFLLFLVSSVNAVHLQLARTVARYQEFATRIALGATPAHLLAQMAAEIMPLVLLGAAAGLGVANFGLATIRKFLSDRLPSELHVGVDAWAVAFTVVLFSVMVIASAVISARRAFRTEFVTALKADGRLSSEKHQGSISSTFVSTQVAFSLTLLIMAFAIIVGLRRLEEVHPGFEQANILTFRISLESETYQDSSITPFYERLMQSLRSLPGVIDTGGVDFLPLGSAGIRGYVRREDQSQAANSTLTIVGYRVATPDYFRTLGIQLREGRYFSMADDAATLGVAVINQETAKRLWPDQSALGKRLQVHSPSADWLTVVGVVGNNKEGELGESDQPLVFEASRQQPARTLYLAVRSNLSPSALLPGIRREVRLLDPSLPLADLNTMRQVVTDSLINPRLQSSVVGVFSVCAIGLTLIGVYAFISYATLQRTQEVGIRVALGAQRSQIFWMVTRDALRLALIGIAAGLVATFVLARLLTSRLWGMPSPDASVIALASLALLLVSLVASFVPAVRAARQDPLHALRGGK